MSRNVDTELVESLVGINRVTKVVKGGSRFSFSAFLIVGDKNGRVGYGHGKAKEVTTARSKAAQNARRKLLKVPLYQNRTIHYDVVGKSGAAKVILRRVKAGTGVIAGGAMRSVFDCLGIHDVVAKSIGSTNVYSMVAATFDALSKLCPPHVIAEKRNKVVGELLNTPKSKIQVREL